MGMFDFIGLGNTYWLTVQKGALAFLCSEHFVFNRVVDQSSYYLAFYLKRN